MVLGVALGCLVLALSVLALSGGFSWRAQAVGIGVPTWAIATNITSALVALAGLVTAVLVARDDDPYDYEPGRVCPRCGYRSPDQARWRCPECGDEGSGWR